MFTSRDFIEPANPDPEFDPGECDDPAEGPKGNALRFQRAAQRRADEFARIEAEARGDREAL